jgi:hemoglobin
MIVDEDYPWVARDLADRGDLEAVLTVFYGAALEDELLGPVFEAAGMELDTHLPRIVSFWEVALLGTGDYVGRPMQLHRHLAETAGLRAEHFGRWLELWHATLDAMYVGPTTERAKSQAVRMAFGMQRAIAGELDPRPVTVVRRAAP